MAEIYIRTQNKEKLLRFGISFNAVEYGEEKDKQGNKHHKLYISDGCLEEIAEYESKERCLKVLDEMQEECQKYVSIVGSVGIQSVSSIPRVYELPKE